MATTTFSIRMDEDVKREFDRFCDKMGMNTSTAFNMFARAVLREKRIPFDIADEGYLHHKWILEQLAKSEKQAADPDVPYRSHDDVMQRFREKYGI